MKANLPYKSTHARWCPLPIEVGLCYPIHIMSSLSTQQWNCKLSPNSGTTIRGWWRTVVSMIDIYPRSAPQRCRMVSVSHFIIYPQTYPTNIALNLIKSHQTCEKKNMNSKHVNFDVGVISNPILSNKFCLHGIFLQVWSLKTHPGGCCAYICGRPQGSYLVKDKEPEQRWNIAGI